MRLWTNTGLYFKGAGGLFLESGAGPSFLQLPAPVLEQVVAGNSEPGVTTLRLPDRHLRPADLPAREVDLEVCFVCKKCRVAFGGESALLTHQRQCFGGKLEARGAFRVVQTGYECKVCSTERFKSSQDLRKHCESEPHAKLMMKVSSSLPPPSESPLSHEMEDVVNQITLLAARAAQESGPEAGAFCQPAEPKRRFLAPEPLTSAGH